MQRFIEGWARLVVRGRWGVLAIALALFGLAFVPIGNLYYEHSNESYFIEGDSNLKAYNLLIELFGDVDYLTIGVSAPQAHGDVFTPQTLQVVRELSDFLDNRPDVTQVRSLSKYQYTHSGDGMLATDDLLDDVNDAASLAEARRIIQGEPLAIGSLITEDLRHTRVSARVRYEAQSNATKFALTQAVQQFIAEQGYAERGYTLQLGGQPIMSEQLETLTRRDQRWVNPTMAVVMIAILYISFRSIAGMLLPWLAIGSAVVYVSGLQGLLKWPHTVVESALIPALIVIGVGISVHVLVTFYQQRNNGRSAKDAAGLTIETLWKPTFFTALTTAAGFLALGVTQLVPVRHFAWLGAMGAMVLFLVAMTLLPAILSFVSGLNPRTRQAVGSGYVARLTQWLPAISRRYRVPLLVLGAALLGISVALLPNLKVDSNFITYFKNDNVARAGTLYFDEQYTGVLNVDLIIDSGEERGIHDPHFLGEVNALQQWLDARPETGTTRSLVDFHKQINQALHGDDPAWYRLPDSREMAAQFLLLYDNTGPEENLTDAKDFHERYLRLLLPVTNMDASATRAFLNEVEDHAAQVHPTLNLQLTGTLVMFNAQDIYVNEGMFRSFLVALAIIGLSFVVLFRSVKYGVIALIPSVVPILMTGAMLVIFDIPLNLGTMVVGAMTMGIAVDDAIHVMSRYLSARRAGSETHPAIVHAMTEAGRAVVFTSLVLVIGFSVMLLGSFIPYIYVGWFAATIMALALVGDLVFLPALLYAVDGREPKQTLVYQNTQTMETEQ